MFHSPPTPLLPLFLFHFLCFPLHFPLAPSLSSPFLFLLISSPPFLPSTPSPFPSLSPLDSSPLPIVMRVTEITQLVTRMLKNDWSLASHLQPITSQYLFIIQKYIQFGIIVLSVRWSQCGHVLCGYCTCIIVLSLPLGYQYCRQRYFHYLLQTCL